VLLRSSVMGDVHSVPIQLAQCRFSGLAISGAEILIYFSNKIHAINFIKQHPETVVVWNYQNADSSFRKDFIVSFIMIFGSLSFPISLASSLIFLCAIVLQNNWNELTSLLSSGYVALLHEKTEYFTDIIASRECVSVVRGRMSFDSCGHRRSRMLSNVCVRTSLALSGLGVAVFTELTSFTHSPPPRPWRASVMEKYMKIRRTTYCVRKLTKLLVFVSGNEK